ncbi:MAG: hypothetical protein JNK82_28940 [Myxococcaceae bacterium]|nr:hypothetical protein [Myxococcaceae bacterium]
MNAPASSPGLKFSVASPCKRDWSKMKGDERVRFCGDCQMNVYNFSAMSQAEVLALVKEREGKVCARFYTRPDGTVLTRDCSVGIARKRRTYTLSFAAVAALFAAPFVTADDTCRVAKGGDGSLGDDVRSLVYSVKLKLCLSKPPMMMGAVAPAPRP